MAKTPAEIEAQMYFLVLTNPTDEVVRQTAQLVVATKATKPVLMRRPLNSEPVAGLPPQLGGGETMTKGEWLMFLL